MVTTRLNTSAQLQETGMNVDKQTDEFPNLVDCSDDNEDEVDRVLLHLIRSIALFLSGFLLQPAKLATEVAELAAFISAGAATSDLLNKPTVALLGRIHAALFEWVHREVDNDHELDGLLQEQGVFVVIQTLFRQQRTKPAVQCRILVALLTSYLARLKSPLVRYEPASMLASTLDYLVATEETSKSAELVPLPVLYPLVNAVDSISIEQRECLDALVTLLRLFSACDPFDKILTAFTTTYHVKLIGAGNTAAERENSNQNVDNARGLCFVQMLLRYSDHIFRRDVQLEPFVPAFSYSDTEDDDDSSEDAGTQSCHHSSYINDNSIHLVAESLGKTSNEDSVDTNSSGKMPAQISRELSELNHEEVLVLRNALRAVKAENAMLKKAASHSQSKHTRHDKQAMTSGTRRSTKFTDETEDKHDHLVGSEWAGGIAFMDVHLVFVGIAAAAGTIAAVLCVFYHL
uniref:Rho-GAP domain-containing protein n=1 Tax=Peronospora matthiolae TaxID=2874970 RepID=A0AAV1UVY9_9STRA